MVDRPPPREGSRPAREVAGGSGARWAGLDPTTARVAWTLLAIGGAMTLVYILRPLKCQLEQLARFAGDRFVTQPVHQLRFDLFTDG